MNHLPHGEEFAQRPFYYMAGKTGGHCTNGWLPVWAHLMDTAGIMQCLITQWIPSRTRQELSNRMGVGDWERVCVLVALLHDIGKLTPLFQSNILRHLPEQRELLEKYGITIAQPDAFINRTESPHALAGEAILLHLGCPVGLAAVVGTHHGRPSDIAIDPEDQLAYYEENYYGIDLEQEELWERIWEDWLALALDCTSYSSIEQVPVLDVPTQMLLSGLLIVADWIASNTNYFPLLAYEQSEHILTYPQRWETGWERVGLPPCWKAVHQEMSDGHFSQQFGFAPNTVQRSLIDAVECCSHPGIFILEAQMGVGKTEAALGAAEQLASKSGCGGIFFGLPTQATANGMFPRLEQWANHQSKEVQHGIRLAHGMADLNEAYQVLCSKETISQDGSGGLVVHPWFEGRKQVLLAEFVIGTVDQLLMAALKQKHVMLRHLGLQGKVVLIDECHAYDSYMNQYLHRILNWLGSYHVPVILLSATLPTHSRKALICAYLNRTYKKKMDEPWEVCRGYPLLTWTDGTQIQQQVIPVDTPRRTVSIRIQEDVPTLLKEQATNNGCVGIIMNTVAQAQTMAQHLRNLFPEKRVVLFHAKFSMADRARKETELLSLLGKYSTDEQRRGLIVVGTQVLEQSLDIDFDLLITQLCPMDLLLQRIGRLHRHKRTRPQGLEQAICVVLNTTDYDEGSQRVYGKWLLMRTAQLLPQQLTLPNDISPLVQETYLQPWDMNERMEGWKEFQAYQLEQTKKERRANNYRLPTQEQLDDTLHGLLDCDLGDSEQRAQASVRDGDMGIDVLLLQRNTQGEVCFLPWQYGGQSLPAQHIPAQEECMQILRQRITLPMVLGGGLESQTIAELETMRNQLVPEWNIRKELLGELFLFLDHQGQATLSGYQLTYSQDDGLSWIKEGT